MSSKCSVTDCKNRYPTSKSVCENTQKNAFSFFEFPSSPERKRKWLDNIGRPHYKPVKSARICSQHFDEKDLARKHNNVMLHKNTIPLPLNSDPPFITSRRLTHNSSRRSYENTSNNNDNQTSNTSLVPEIGQQQQPLNSTELNNSETSVPPTAIRSRRNSVFVGKYNFGIRKTATAVKMKLPNPVAKKIVTASHNQLSMKNFLSNQGTSATQPNDKIAVVSSREDCIFGWTLIGCHDIPFIVRDSEIYCALRMIEKTALASYEKKNPIVESFKANVETYDPTDIQCNLLNEINDQHCDSAFGQAPFTYKDKLLRLSDASKYFTFLEVCRSVNEKGVQVSTVGHQFGFTLINKKAYVPYAVINGRKFIPLIYLHCDGEILEFLSAKSEPLSGDDALLLKLCCKYDGILELNDAIDVIDLSEIQRRSPAKTTFTDCWPTAQRNYQLRVVQTVKGLRLEFEKRMTYNITR